MVVVLLLVLLDLRSKITVSMPLIISEGNKAPGVRAFARHLDLMMKDGLIFAQGSYKRC